MSYERHQHTIVFPSELETAWVAYQLLNPLVSFNQMVKEAVTDYLDEKEEPHAGGLH